LRTRRSSTEADFATHSLRWRSVKSLVQDMKIFWTNLFLSEQ
jgi:hypothetical protein